MTENKILSKEEIKRSLEYILEDCEKITVENTDIFIVDDVKFIEIKKLYACAKYLAENELAEEKKSEENGEKKRAKRGPFYNFGKILNLDEYPIIAYKTFLKHKYINITDKEKVKKQIEREYGVAKNKTNGFYDKLLEAQKDIIDEELENKIKKERNDKLADIEKEFKFIEENIDSLDIRITTFREDKKYPHIRLIDVNEEEYIDFLRAEVPNILYGHRNIFEMKEDYRKDARHIKFILDATHAFGEIFYKKKKK